MHPKEICGFSPAMEEKQPRMGGTRWAGGCTGLYLSLGLQGSLHLHHLPPFQQQAPGGQQRC